jgi:hypothetical protein
MSSKMIKSMIAAMTKAGRMTIDFSDEDDVKFFTPLLAKALKKVKHVDEEKEKIPKAQNSYMEFCKETRANTDFSDVKDPKEVSRSLGKMWRELSDKAKDVYKQRALVNKGKYDEACRARSTSPVSDADSEKSEKAKRPLSAYIKFCSANRSDVAKSHSNPQDVSRRLGEMWRGLSDETKQQWKDDSVEAVEEEKVEVPVIEEIPKKASKKVEEPVIEDTPKKASKKVKSDDEDEEKTAKKTKKVKSDDEDEEKTKTKTVKKIVKK